MSFLDKFKPRRTPVGRTRPAVRTQHGWAGRQDRGYVDSQGTFFLLDGTVPDDSDYTGPAEVESTSRTDSGSTTGPDYVTGGSDYSYHNRGSEPAPSSDSGWSSGSSSSGGSYGSSSSDSSSYGGSSGGSSDSSSSSSSGGSDY